MTGKTRRTSVHSAQRANVCEQTENSGQALSRRLGARLVSLATAATVATVTTIAACGGGESSCDFWTDKLARTGEIEKALQKLGELKCKEAAPVLKQLFDEGLLQEAVITVLQKIDDGPTAVPVMRSALVTPRTARQAATLVRDWKLKETVPELVRILSEDALFEAREPALEALLALDGPASHEDLLISLVLADPNKQPVEINRRAVTELGNIGSKKAVPTLVKAIFLRGQKGQDAYVQVRHALAQVGDATVTDELVKVLAGKNAELLEFATKNGFEPWEVTSTPKVVQLLSDALDPRAVDALVADLAADIAPPAEVSDQVFARWFNDKSNRYLVTSFALAYMGSETAVAGLAAVFRDPTKDVMRQRVNAAKTLGMLGSEAAQDVLIRAWRGELIVEVLRAGVLEIVALAVDDRRLAQWDEMLGIVAEGQPKPKKPVELSEPVKEVLDENERIRSYIQVVRECKDALPCYLAKTKSDIQHEAIKALSVLGRGRFGVTDEIKTALLAAFESAPKEMVDTKRYALIGLTRLGNQADGEALVAKGLAMTQADPFWGAELFSLGQGLKRRMMR